MMVHQELNPCLSYFMLSISLPSYIAHALPLIGDLSLAGHNRGSLLLLQERIAHLLKPGMVGASVAGYARAMLTNAMHAALLTVATVTHAQLRGQVAFAADARHSCVPDRHVVNLHMYWKTLLIILQ